MPAPIPNPLPRINRYLALCGISSRRKCEQLIREGRVMVNGQVNTGLSTRIDQGCDVVEVDGRKISPVEQLMTLMLHKPLGYACTCSDPHAPKTVLDLIPKKLLRTRLYPVGRLDLDSTGLILLTNDGVLTNRLLHPSHKIGKTYVVTVEGHPRAQDWELLRSGIELEDGPTAPAQVSDPSPRGDHTIFRMVLFEGRKRQIRRMCAALGFPVMALHREKFGDLELGDLPLGKWRELGPEDLGKLL